MKRLGEWSEEGWGPLAESQFSAGCWGVMCGLRRRAVGRSGGDELVLGDA